MSRSQSVFSRRMRRMTSRRPKQFYGPTVVCSLANDPQLRSRSYVSPFLDVKGVGIPVHDGMAKSPSQHKRRRLARQGR